MLQLTLSLITYVRLPKETQQLAAGAQHLAQRQRLHGASHGA